MPIRLRFDMGLKERLIAKAQISTGRKFVWRVI
jgi:hypothetical protein